MKKFIIEKLKKNVVPIFIVTDILLVVASAYASFLLRFDGQVPPDRMDNFYAFTILAVIATTLVFSLSGLYKVSWKYISITDLPHIFSAVLLSGFVVASTLFVLRDLTYFEGFSRSIVVLYIIILFLLVSLLRFSKRVYWQIIKSDAAPFTQDESPLPLTRESFNKKEVKNVLITGGAGYIGSVLAQQLLEDGYNVRVLDKMLFGSDSLAGIKGLPNFQCIEGDILDKEVLKKALVDVDAVVNLAAIVGEPACVSQKDVALQTNYLGAVYVARLCKAMGIKRFIQASTCSTYGQSEENSFAMEKSKLFPVDFYGETKIYAEREIIKLIDEHFNPTILRFSTVYGLSYRMRFDLVLNTFTKKAVKEKEIVILGGAQWRPLIHVSDVANAIGLVLKAPLSKVANQIFNVGSGLENYTILRLGELVKECIPEVTIKTIDSLRDERNYKVDFSKIEKVLDFSVKKTAKDGIIEIRDAIENGSFADVEDKKYYNHLVT